MTDPNLPTMRTRINGLALSSAEKTWAQKESDAHPNLATTWTPETDIDSTAFIKQSATQFAPPGVIVTQEEYDEAQRNKAFIEFVAKNTKLNGPTSSRGSNVPFKMELIQQYNLETSGNYIHDPNNFQVRCQISDVMYYTNSGQGARKEYVKACHIIASSRKALLPSLGFEGDLDVLVNNWRNGIMMLSSIETMLESHDLCLGHNPFDGTWVCLIPNHDSHGIIVTPPGHLPSVSAGDLHKKVITTMNGITPGPYRRVMGCFAAATYHKAACAGKLSQEDNDLHQDYFTASANSSNGYRDFVSEYVKGITADPSYGQNAPAQIVSAQNAPAQIVPPPGAYQCNCGSTYQNKKGLKRHKQKNPTH